MAPGFPRLRAFGSLTVMPVTPGPPRAAVTRATSVASLPRRRTETFARGSQPGVASSCSNADSLPLYATSFTLIVRSLPSAQRSWVRISAASGRPPSNASVKLRTGRSGFEAKVFRVPWMIGSTRPSSRTPTGSGSRTSRPGSGFEVLKAT